MRSVKHARAVAAIAAGRYPTSRARIIFYQKNAAPLVGEFIRFALIGRRGQDRCR